jgi:L-ascorbate metabolism protein UlaG (beta-lactamase superfamily)
MVELLAVGSAQEVVWLRMPAKRLTIGPSLVPHEHVIVLDPSMPPTTLVYVSHDYIHHIDSFEFAHYSYTAAPTNKPKAKVLRLPNSSAHQTRNRSRHSPSSLSTHHKTAFLAVALIKHLV